MGRIQERSPVQLHIELPNIPREYCLAFIICVIPKISFSKEVKPYASQFCRIPWLGMPAPNRSTTSHFLTCERRTELKRHRKFLIRLSCVGLASLEYRFHTCARRPLSGTSVRVEAADAGPPVAWRDHARPNILDHPLYDEAQVTWHCTFRQTVTTLSPDTTPLSQ